LSDFSVPGRYTRNVTSDAPATIRVTDSCYGATSSLLRIPCSWLWMEIHVKWSILRVSGAFLTGSTQYVLVGPRLGLEGSNGVF